MRRFIKTINIVSILLILEVAEVQAVMYIETYETEPGGTGYAALLGSPNGLVYDNYDARAFSRLAGYPVTVTRVRLFKKQIPATTSETIEYSEY